MEKIIARLKFPLLAAGLLALVAGTWAGLLRIGWTGPLIRPNLPAAHGPLMVGGFLGTVIGLERAVALAAALGGGPPLRWPYLGPLLTGLGGLSLLIAPTAPIGAVLLTAGSLNLVLVFGTILRRHLAAYTMTMALGALVWFLGNLLWLLGQPLYMVVWWWSGFLILTIAGERLELGRILRHSRAVQTLFWSAAGLLLAGLPLSLFWPAGGVRLNGLGALGLALWLLRFDVARYTVRKTGLTRFMALALLSGYGWLAFSGVLSLWFGPVSGGLRYDAGLHAVYLGFVLAMIFAHAPIIFPAITGRPIPFRPTFYLHLGLLQLSLVIRVASDLAVWPIARQWSGLFNALALALFLFNTAYALLNAEK